jgi:NAD(P)-dependent dehydrogenase (short-subunit alcohol dehydrogenase family)
MSNDRPKAIVTGAASGLGRAIAVRLARDGWHVALVDLDEAGSDETLAMVRAAGGEGQCERLDVTRPEQWQALRQRLQAAWPQLDLLVNNAGVAGAGEVGQFSLDDWRWIVETNLLGTVHGCHTFIDWLKRNPRGAHLVNTASLFAWLPAPTMAAYSASKAAVLSLSETLSIELAAHGVGVTVLCPGFFASNLLARGRISTDEQRQAAERLVRAAPITAADVADAAVRAIQAGQLHVILPRSARWWWRLRRWLPGTFLKLLARRYRQEVINAKR